MMPMTVTRAVVVTKAIPIMLTPTMATLGMLMPTAAIPGVLMAIEVMLTALTSSVAATQHAYAGCVDADHGRIG